MILHRLFHSFNFSKYLVVSCLCFSLFVMLLCSCNHSSPWYRWYPSVEREGRIEEERKMLFDFLFVCVCVCVCVVLVVVVVGL